MSTGGAGEMGECWKETLTSAESLARDMHNACTDPIMLTQIRRHACLELAEGFQAL